MKRLLGVALLCALATSACGSTLPRSTTTASGGARDEFGAPLDGSDSARDAVDSSSSGVDAPVVAGGTSATTARSSNGTTASTARVTGPLKVGLLYLEGAESLGSSLGVEGLDTGDPQAQATAVAGWINSHGGVAGRQIQLAFSGIRPGEAVDNPGLAQEAGCRKLTEDEKVAIAISYLQLEPNTMSCFSKGGAAMIDDASALADDVAAQYARIFAAPGDLAPGRLMTELVDALWRTGWLNKTSVVGAYHYNGLDKERLVKNYLEPALAKHGLKLAKRASTANSVEGASQNSSVVLQFRSAGIDRIIPVMANPLFLMQAATSQGYKPKYALYSTFGPGALMESAAPRDQVEGAAGIGWQPYLDIGRGTKAPQVSSNETLCFQIFEAAGQSSTSATARGLQLTLCNAMLYLKVAADKVGSVPPDLLLRARAVVGTSFSPADTFRSDVTKRADGVAAYRDIAFDDGCKCFQYTSPIRPTS